MFATVPTLTPVGIHPFACYLFCLCFRFSHKDNSLAANELIARLSLFFYKKDFFFTVFFAFRLNKFLQDAFNEHLVQGLFKEPIFYIFYNLDMYSFIL
jgi:hypothetical protein